MVLPSNKSLIEISPFESFDSYKLKGLIKSLDILPVPVCIESSNSLGTAEPVKIN